MSELILRTQLADGRTIAQPISAFAALVVEPGATYTIVDAETQQTPTGLAFERKDEDLEIQLDGEPVVVLDDFYTAETAATFSADGALGTDVALSSADLPAVSEAGALDAGELPHVSDGGLLSIPAGATLNPLTWGTPGLIGAGTVGAAGIGTGIGVAVADDDDDDSPSGPNTSNVVFDLVDGDSSDHSDRTFDANTTYTIYIRVPSDGGLTNIAIDERWTGVQNLGTDDVVVLVGDGSPVRAWFSGSSVTGMYTEGDWIYWSGSEGGTAFSLADFGNLWRYQSTTTTTTFTFTSESVTFTSTTPTTTTTTDTARLFDTEGGWTENPNSNASFSQAYLTTMPAGVLTSQGLA